MCCRFEPYWSLDFSIDHQADVSSLCPKTCHENSYEILGTGLRVVVSTVAPGLVQPCHQDDVIACLRARRGPGQRTSLLSSQASGAPSEPCLGACARVLTMVELRRIGRCCVRAACGAKAVEARNDLDDTTQCAVLQRVAHGEVVAIPATIVESGNHNAMAHCQRAQRLSFSSGERKGLVDDAVLARRDRL